MKHRPVNCPHKPSDIMYGVGQTWCPDCSPYGELRKDVKK